MKRIIKNKVNFKKFVAYRNVKRDKSLDQKEKKYLNL